MEPLPVDILQLQRRDPSAWSALLARMPDMDDAIVTAVTAEPLWDNAIVPPGRAVVTPTRGVRRYILTLAGVSDPVSFIAKQTNAAEAILYRLYGDPPGTALPPCRYTHADGDESWIVLEDVPNHFPPHAWSPHHVDRIVTTIARLHAAHWNKTSVSFFDNWGTAEPVIPHFIHREEGSFTWEDLRQKEKVLFEEGPGSVLSSHAILNTGRLAPLFLRAANGLVVIRDLGGWPGVLGESHIAAAADLLDDPVPMLAPLLDLPATLLHGAPHPGNWHLTLFDESYLLDWREVQIGPGILDLAVFLETFPLYFGRRPAETDEGQPRLHLREMTPLVEETIVDTYLLGLSAELGSRVSARAIRAALPAARCLQILLSWFPFFAEWATEMPDRYLWQRINRLPESELDHYAGAPTAGLRPYLAEVFRRFLRAYRSL